MTKTNNETKQYDVIIVGAGGAGIFASRELAKAGKEVLIIDAGVSLDKKRCPIEHGEKCKFCKPVCNIMGGFGGAQFFEGTKLSVYPAGSGFVPFCGSVENTKSTYKYIDNVLEMHGKAPRPLTQKKEVGSLIEQFDNQGITMKYYNAQKVSKNKMNYIAGSLRREIETMGVTINMEERVTDIDGEDGNFKVTTDKDSYNTKKIIFGIGRVGSRQLTKIADKIGIKYEDEEQEMEIGVRVEMPYEVFNKINNIHNDLKLKKVLPDGSELRTFCQDYKGYITKCVYNLTGDKVVTSLDGHIIGTDEEANSGNLSDVVNLAVHHRFKVDKSLDEIYDTINKMNRNGKPVIQSMKNFMDNTEGENILSNELSLKDVVEGNINDYLPEDTLKVLKDFILDIDKVIEGFADSQNTIYSPSFEMGWKKFILSDTMETTCKGIYIAGDATGHFRGAIQAMASGALVGDNICDVL